MSFWNRQRLIQNLSTVIDAINTPNVSHSAYELTLGGQAFTTDVAKPIDLLEGKTICISPGEFALLTTRESINVPDGAIGLLSIKFKLKQRGLLNVSGFHVDPGYKGHLIFSVFNAASRPILIKAGQPIFLLWLADLGEPSDMPYGNGITSEEIPPDLSMNLQTGRDGKNRLSLAALHQEVTRLESKLTTILTVAVSLLTIVGSGTVLIISKLLFVD